MDTRIPSLVSQGKQLQLTRKEPSSDTANRKNESAWMLLTEDLVQAVSHISNVPLVKVLGLVGRGASAGFESSIDEVVQAFYLLLLIQDGDVVLEWIGYPFALVANVRDSLSHSIVSNYSFSGGSWANCERQKLSSKHIAT